MHVPRIARFLPAWWVLGPAVALAQPQEPTPASPAPADLQNYRDEVTAAMKVSPGGLTADEAARRAVANSPSIEGKRLEARLTALQHRQTGLRYLPKVTASGSATITNRTDYDFGSSGFSVGALNAGALTVGPCPGGGGTCVLDAAGVPVGAVAGEPFEVPRTTYRVDLSLSVPFSDYLFGAPAAARASRADVAAAERRADADQTQVELDARVAYYDWLRARAQIAVTDLAVANTQARLQDAQIGLQSGTVAPADVLQIESAVASAQISTHNALSMEVVARTNLALIMGTDEASFGVGEDLQADIGPVEQLGDLPGLIAHAQQKRAEALALDQATIALEEADKSVTSDMYPRLDGVANLTYANPNPQFFPPSREWNASWSLGLSVSWSLDGYLRSRNQRNDLAVRRRITGTQRRQLQRGIGLEVTAAWQDWQRASAALALNHKAREAAEAAYEQRVELYRAGEATTSEIVEAELQRHNATLLDIDARIAVRVARARLLHATARERP
jgi:outer membrane protein TolC